MKRTETLSSPVIMKVVIKEKEHEYQSDYPQGWLFASGDPFKFPVSIGRYTCFVKRFEKKSPADISGWSLMQQVKDKFEPDLPRIYDVVEAEENGRSIYYVFYEHLTGETLEAAVNRNADLNLRRLTDDLFKGLNALHNKHFWFMDFCEKNIFCESSGRFLFIDLDSVQPESQRPHNHMDGDKQYWALVFTFYKEQLGYKDLKPGDLSGPMLNYLQLIFLVLRLKISLTDKRYDYKSPVLYDNLPALLAETDPGFKDLFVRASEESQKEQQLLSGSEVKEFILRNIIQNDRVPYQPTVTEPVISSFEASATDIEPGQTFSLSWEVAHTTRLELHRNGRLHQEIQNTANSLDIREAYDGKPKKVVYQLVAMNSSGEKKSEPITVSIAEAIIPETSEVEITHSQPIIEPEEVILEETSTQNKAQTEINTRTNDTSTHVTNDPEPVIIPKIKPDPKKLRSIRIALLVLFLAIAAVLTVVAFSLFADKKIKVATLKASVKEGDAFIIPGKNFPVKPGVLLVFFNNFRSTVIAVTSDTLRVLVPEMNTTTDSIPARLALLVNKDTVFTAANITVRRNEPIAIAGTKTVSSTTKPDTIVPVLPKRDSIPDDAGRVAASQTLTATTGKPISGGKSKSGNSQKTNKTKPAKINPVKPDPKKLEPDPTYPTTPPDVDLNKLVTVSSNVIANQKRKGTKDLQITIQNSSPYDLDNVNVEVNYKKKNGKLLHKEILTFTKVRAHTSQTQTAPDDEQSKKVDFKIVAINSKQIQLY
ncbi:hypothetical protein [Adhaeribacter arboris]|nr:hypothetical protein [Adhaeribacter arboris]